MFYRFLRIEFVVSNSGIQQTDDALRAKLGIEFGIELGITVEVRVPVGIRVKFIAYPLHAEAVGCRRDMRRVSADPP